MTAIKSQLEAGLKRHESKPYVLPPIVYEDDQIYVRRTEGRDWISYHQFNKPKADKIIAVAYTRK